MNRAVWTCKGPAANTCRFGDWEHAARRRGANQDAERRPGGPCRDYEATAYAASARELRAGNYPALSFGYFYAPFVISRFTKNATRPNQAGKTGDQADVMQSTLAWTP